MSEEKDIRTRMLQTLAKYNIKQVDVARQAGIHHSTLSLWLQGKVKGHHIGIQDTLSQWLQNLTSGRHRYTTLNKANDKQFILTPYTMNIKAKKSTDIQDVLIPVNLDLDLQIEGKKYKQVFCWNVNDPYFTPQQFAKCMVLENSILASYENKIVQAIRKAINNYNLQSNKSLKQQSIIEILHLDIKVGNMYLKDRFQWDICDESNSPQDFAYSLCQQLNLNGEFMAKIAHQIRQQIQFFRKNARISQNGPDRMKPEQIQGHNSLMDMKKTTRHLLEFSGNYRPKSSLPVVTVENYIRYMDLNEWQPEIGYLDANEVKKSQKNQERKNRYAARRNVR